MQSLCREATPWSEEDYRRLLRGDGTLRCAVVESRDRLAGFIVYQPLSTETEIANLGVHPDHRRQGVGSALLTYVCRQHPGDLYLEVRQSNRRAIDFYRALEFPIATRAHYYRDSGEEALVLKRTGSRSGADEGGPAGR